MPMPRAIPRSPSARSSTSGTPPQDRATLLEVDHLSVTFRLGVRSVRAVEDLSLRVQQGETVALVGESGCGKTVTALALARLLPRSRSVRIEGSIRFRGEDVLGMDERELRRLRGRGIAYVFQEPATALNPTLSVQTQIEEGIRVHRPEANPREEALRLLSAVGLCGGDAILRLYPHELSGGMRQRVVLACALACQPELLVADEPTTALDVTIQAQILDLLQGLQEQMGLAVLLITHNLALVAHLAHRVYVLYAGRLLESGPTDSVLREPRHPYTAALLAAVPRLRDEGAELRSIPGSVPEPGEDFPGCAFAPRCGHAQPVCKAQDPPWVPGSPPASASPSGRALTDRAVRCWGPLEYPMGSASMSGRVSNSS